MQLITTSSPLTTCCSMQFWNALYWQCVLDGCIDSRIDDLGFIETLLAKELPARLAMNSRKVGARITAGGWLGGLADEQIKQWLCC